MSAIKQALWKMGTFHILKCLDWNVHMMKKIRLATSKSTSVRKQQGFHHKLSMSARKTLCQFSFPCLWFNSFIVLTQVRVWPQASIMAQLVKNPPALWETWVPSLGWEDPQVKRKATHSSLAWRIPWTVQSMGLHRVRHDWATFTSLSLFPRLTFY